MFFIRLLVILISVAFTISVNSSFAASGSSWSSSGAITTKIKNVEKDGEENLDNDAEDKKVEDKKTEKNAQKIILEVYKIQGNKILKDMDASIEKVNPDPKVRIEIYTSIQKTLEFRKQKLEKSELSDESKDILTWYIGYMIAAIEKKKKNLE